MVKNMHRRDFLSISTFAAATMLFGSLQAKAAASQLQIPRWRGFNLTELAGGQPPGQHYQETDFEWLAEWGFNFVRLPCSYWLWSDRQRWLVINDNAFLPLDRAIALAQKHGIHVNIAMHRIPGYCVNGRELEPHQLFDSPRESMLRALEAAAYHWQYIAQRYKEVPSSQLSFDLLNEPPFMVDQSRYIEIATALIATIHEVSPDRIVFADGADIGQTPVVGLLEQRIVQSTRGYLPKMVSHYTANWVPSRELESLSTPTWPMTDDHGVLWNRDKLREELIAKWHPLTELGAPVHVGEWGCFNKTPHEACLAWMKDLLGLWKEVGWGWSMWNLRGSFGILDSGRADVQYENFRGHKLDRKMLELLSAN